MAELLLELFSEEIPAKMQSTAAEHLKTRVLTALDELGISYERADAYATPRRLTLIIDELPKVQEDSVTERKGPRVDAPQQAIDGFLKSVGLNDISELDRRTNDKGEFYFAITKQEGRSLVDIFKEVIEDILDNFTWPKSMRWGDYSIRWVRPLHNILCLFNHKVVPVEFGHLTANDTSYGHRFLSPDSFTVKDSRDYWEKLRQHHVILGAEERKDIIMTNITKLAKKHKVQLKKDDELVDEVVGLVEWPEVLLGNIDNRFMQLPEEVLISSMRTHQRYFSLTHEGSSIAPYFITVANITSNDNGKQIITGNERVLRARLADAEFYWNHDQKRSLESRVEDLQKVVFHNKLGSVAEKVKRMCEIAKFLAVWIPHANLLMVERSAKLCKTDLTTGMVQEFPELQGIVGSYYAANDKEEPEVVNAIRNHYQPSGQNAEVPTDPVTVAVALADKIDTLVGLFAIGEKPTGSKDPYALRRATLGVIRIILDNNLRIPLRLVFEKSLKSYPKMLVKEKGGLAKKILGKKKDASPEGEKNKKKFRLVIDDLLEFFEDRLKVLLRAQHVRHDYIDAVFDGGAEDDIVRLVNRVLVLESFLTTEDGVNLLAAYKRASNIVEKEEKKDNKAYDGAPVRSLLVADQEVELCDLLETIDTDIAKALKEDQFTEAMSALARLRIPVDAFFEHVQVNCSNEEVRENRLKLLSQIRSLIDDIANFSKIEGQTVEVVVE